MKKSRLCLSAIGLSLLTVLCACTTTPSASLSANWFKDTAAPISGSIDEIETLVYDVTFEPSKADEYAPVYTDATYTTVLKVQSVALSDGSYEDCYYLKSEFKADVRFSVKGSVSEVYKDSMTSEVWFRSVRDSLNPVRSKKTAVSHTPVDTPPASLSENYYRLYEYEYEVEYDKSLSNATVKKHYTRLNSADAANGAQPYESDSENEIKIKKPVNFFDNEQIMFALRALDMNTAVKIMTVNPAEGKVTTSANVSAPSKKTEAVSFQMTVGGNTQSVPESIDAFQTTLAYNGGMPGQSQTLTYAAKTDMMNNTYRNVLLKMQVPLSFSLGTLTYTLKSAAFLDY